MRDLFQLLITTIESILQWVLDVILFYPKKIFELYLDGLATVIEGIETPEIITQFTMYTNQFLAQSGVAYFADLFQLSEGFQIILGSYLLALLIRLIPGIG